jgi:hypothetical protein
VKGALPSAPNVSGGAKISEVNDQVPAIVEPFSSTNGFVYLGAFLLSMGAPKHKDYPAFLFIQVVDHGICRVL